MTKTEMAEMLADSYYAVRTGQTDRDYLVRQYLRMNTKEELTDKLERMTSPAK